MLLLTKRVQSTSGCVGVWVCGGDSYMKKGGNARRKRIPKGE